MVNANKATQMDDFMIAINQIVNAIMYIGVYIAIIPRKRQFATLTAAIQNIVDERTYVESAIYYIINRGQ